jgi:hypothetical protein
MRAKFVYESVGDYSSTENMAQNIASHVYVIYHGDDIAYRPNEKDKAKLKELIKSVIDTSYIKNDKYFDTFGDEEWILNNLTDEEINNLYHTLRKRENYVKKRYHNTHGYYPHLHHM